MVRVQSLLTLIQVSLLYVPITLKNQFSISIFSKVEAASCLFPNNNILF